MSMAERELRRWTVNEYLRMIQADVFGPDERLELIQGEIVRMSPQGAAHAMVCDLVEEALRSAFGGGFVVRGQKPVVAGSDSLPEPDIYVVRGRVRDLVQHPSSPVLVVEVSDSSVAFDLITKAALYARGGFPEYWVVVIPERSLIVHRGPDVQAGEYRSVERFGEHAVLTALEAPDGGIRVVDLLP
ncbi:MAG: uncharacterized protein K0Q72_624 [Armatimonadetes bacterium]|jgi:Uma2 family endonuclease|nr:uncharacterized protein [Armatimonadota bacterium]